MEHLALPLGKTLAGGKSGQPLAKLKNQRALLTFEGLNVADKALIKPAGSAEKSVQPLAPALAEWVMGLQDIEVAALGHGHPFVK
jgi:hypothetical protein